MFARALLLLAVAAAAVTVPVGAARAGPPFVTDDPETVEARQWEINVAGQAIHDSGGWTGSAPVIDANYGAMPDLQLHLQGALAFDAAEHEPTHFGYGDTELGVKYRFVHEGELCPQVAVYPFLELPTGNDAQGLGSGHVRAFLPVWLQKSWGESDRPWTAYGGGGYWINPGSGNRNWGYFGALLQRRVSDSLALGAEVFYQTAQETGTHGSTWLNGGLIWDLGETYRLIASAGHNIEGRSGFQAYLGIQLNFGPR